MKDVLSYGIGTLFAFALILFIVFIFIKDITQKPTEQTPPST